MKNEKTFLPPNLGLAPFCKSRGMTLQIAQLQHVFLPVCAAFLFCSFTFLYDRNLLIVIDV